MDLGGLQNAASPLNGLQQAAMNQSALNNSYGNGLSQYLQAQNALLAQNAVPFRYKEPLRNAAGQTVHEWADQVERFVQQYEAAGLKPTAYVNSVFEMECAEWEQLARDANR